MASNKRALMWWSLRLLFGLFMIGVLFTRVDFNGLWLVVTRVTWYLLGILIGLYFLGVFISTIKWKILISDYAVRVLFLLSLIGQFYSLVLPGQIAGEAVKAYKLGKGRKDAEVIAASVLLDKITGLISLLILGLVGLHFSALDVPRSVLIGLSVALGVGMVALALARLPGAARTAHRFFSAMETRYAKLRRPLVQLRFLLESWVVYVKRPALIAKSVLLGFCYQLVHVGIILLLARQFGISVSIPDWLWIFAVISIAVLMPVTVGGVGVREGAFVGILATMGVAPESALAISLTIFSLQILAALTGFILELLTSRQAEGAIGKS